MFVGPATGKAGAGSGNKLRPIAAHIGDVVKLIGAYDFTGSGGTGTHHLRIYAIPTIVSADPMTQNVPFTEASAGVYTFDLGVAVDIQDQPVAGIMNTDSSGTPQLHLTDNAINEHDYLLVTVCTGTVNSVGGVVPTGPSTVVDFMIIYIERSEVTVHDVTLTGLDTNTLDVLLGLAGHNVKMRTPTYIAGTISTREIDLFDNSLDSTTQPLLLDPDDNTGQVLTALLGKHKIITTQDDRMRPQQDVSEPE